MYRLFTCLTFSFILLISSNFHIFSSQTIKNHHGSGEKKISYTINEKDNDYTIARKFGMRLNRLHQLNPTVNWNRLMPGRTVYVIESIDNVHGASENNKVNESSVQLKQYTVVKGDNDWDLARKHGITLEELYRLNPDINWDCLQEGEKIFFPKCSNISSQSSDVKTKDIKTKDVKTKEGASEKQNLKISSPLNMHVEHVKVVSDDVNIRVSSNTHSTKIGMATLGEVFRVIESKNDWCLLENNKSKGWVSSRFLTPTSEQIAKSNTLVASNNKNKKGQGYSRQQDLDKLDKASGMTSQADDVLLQNAREYLGVRYRLCGTSRSGIDCSGFTAAVYAKHGVNLPHSSREQASYGKHIEKKDLQKGDLVFFGKGQKVKRINHVGIYIGDGQFIHASSGRGRVTVSGLNENYYMRTYAGARRLMSVN